MVSAMEKTEDAWYLKRLSDVQKSPRALPMWKIENGHLYHHRANKWLDPILTDLDSWKMVLPKEHHAAALAEAHDQPQAGHLGVDKTYHRFVTRYNWLGFYHDVAQYVRV